MPAVIVQAKTVPAETVPVVIVPEVIVPPETVLVVIVPAAAWFTKTEGLELCNIFKELTSSSTNSMTSRIWIHTMCGQRSGWLCAKRDEP